MDDGPFGNTTYDGPGSWSRTDGYSPPSRPVPSPKLNRRERRRARRAERDRLSGYDRKTGDYSKGGIALPNVPPPRVQDEPPTAPRKG